MLDASAALPWCFADEKTPLSEQLRERALAGEVIHVPAHWPTEVLNSATRAVRRGRLEEPTVDTFLRALLTMHIVVDAARPAMLWDETQPLIAKYRLSGYDAAYLALAKRLRVELATLDAQLALASHIEGVPVSSLSG